MSQDGAARLAAFFRARHNVYLARQGTALFGGLPWPWTQDPILQKYRFCNVYRELDRTTIWLRQNWYNDNSGDPDLWFAATVARHVNLPATLEIMGWPIRGGKPPYFREEAFRSAIEQRMRAGLPAYSAAYMIRAAAVAVKHMYLSIGVLGPMWVNRHDLCYRLGEPLADFYARLYACYGMGSFMTGQVIADAKFCGLMTGAPDWWSFAVPGPGSLRGMNRVYGRPPGTHTRTEEWQENLVEVQLLLGTEAHRMGWPRVSAQDAQNVLCEFDKYERARLGEGRPKQNYRRTA